MVPRIRGASKPDAAPPKALRLSLRVRAWQVSNAYLQDHPEWLATGRVAPSGVAWGDLEDPKEDEKPQAKRVQDRGGKGKKIRRVGNVADVAEAQAQLDLVAGGADIDRMFKLS